MPLLCVRKSAIVNVVAELSTSKLKMYCECTKKNQNSSGSQPMGFPIGLLEGLDKQSYFVCMVGVEWVTNCARES